MMNALLARLFGGKAETAIRTIHPLVDEINRLEPSVRALSDAQLAAKTREFRGRLAGRGSPPAPQARQCQRLLARLKGKAAPPEDGLDLLLIEAFAVVREACRRTFGTRLFDVQLLAGIVLHCGRIAEIQAGEGQTLTTALPVYLNALAGRGVHIVEANDYLAWRESDQTARLYKFLDLTAGVVAHRMDDDERRACYRCDITYGTNNDFGFDYLRDNMKFRLEDCVQRELNFAIVDEVDFILIDEARVPLTIVEPGDGSTDKYYRAKLVAPRLGRGEMIAGRGKDRQPSGDYAVDVERRKIVLSDAGLVKVNRLLGLSDPESPEARAWKRLVEQALAAQELYKRDRDYVVSSGEVVILDVATGRLLTGRRWSNGLHQAIEVKEGVQVQPEYRTVAAISFQNYFRLYRKLAGISSTAASESEEFKRVYGLDISVIPAHSPVLRLDLPDIVYRTDEEKLRNAAREIQERHGHGQPVFAGAVSSEQAAKLSTFLRRMGVRHTVLDEQNQAQEALVMAQAGRKDQVTVSSIAAGRGTDILLGGDPERLAQEECLQRGLAEAPPETEPAAGESSDYTFSRGEFTAYRVPRGVWQAVYTRHQAICGAEHDEVVRLGGLYIVGVERRASRRLDNRLCGRAGLRGELGSSRFYLSLQDELLRIFGGDRIQNLMLRLGMEEDVPIESGLITKRIRSAQKKLDARNFATRMHLLECDDVINQQRQAVYALRRSLLGGEPMQDRIRAMIERVVAGIVDQRCPAGSRPASWDLWGVVADVDAQFGARVAERELRGNSRDRIRERMITACHRHYGEKEAELGREVMRDAESVIMLSQIDQQWKDHLLAMDNLEGGIDMRAFGDASLMSDVRKGASGLLVGGLAMQAYGRKSPLPAFKKEAAALFDDMMRRVESETVRYLFFVQPAPAQPSSEPPVEAPPVGEDEPARIGRNDPCPCGSGKKYKKCCGADKWPAS
jgi:preprotein translocase subunit SecA